MALIREGLSNPEIAARLCIGREEVKSHVSEILGKLGVASREEAARWEPSDRPWWAGAAAPMAWLWRGARVSWLGIGAAGITAVLFAAGALLVWGLVRTGGDAGEPPAAPIASVGDLLACYRERPASADGLAATRSIRGASVSVGGKDIEANQADQLLSSLTSVEPAYLGVRGTPGTKIGDPGRLGETTIEIDLGSGSLSLKYVRPGPVAPYGLLFEAASIGAWEYVTLVIPSGYAQSVCTVPPEFDRVMGDLGFKGYDPVDLLETRLVLVTEAQREWNLVEQIEVWGEGEARRELSLATLEGFADPLRWNELAHPPIDGTQADPLEPFTGEPLSVEVRFRGIDPFPEAVWPAEFLYYTADATASGRGVLVPLTAIAIYNGSYGPGDAYFPGPELDQLLREAASYDPGPGDAESS